MDHIPSNAPHPQAAEQFIAFLLGPTGQAVMAQNYQPCSTAGLRWESTNARQLAKPVAVSRAHEAPLAFLAALDLRPPRW